MLYFNYARDSCPLQTAFSNYRPGSKKINNPRNKSTKWKKQKIQLVRSSRNVAFFRNEIFSLDCVRHVWKLFFLLSLYLSRVVRFYLINFDIIFSQSVNLFSFSQTLLLILYRFKMKHFIILKYISIIAHEFWFSLRILPINLLFKLFHFLIALRKYYLDSM